MHGIREIAQVDWNVRYLLNGIFRIRVKRSPRLRCVRGRVEYLDNRRIPHQGKLAGVLGKERREIPLKRFVVGQYVVDWRAHGMAPMGKCTFVSGGHSTTMRITPWDAKQC